MNKKKYLKTFIIIVVILFFCSAFIVYYFALRPELQLIENKHEGSEFFVKGDKVYIEGGIEVKNNSKKDMEFSVIGISEEDYKIGLLKSNKLKCYDRELVHDTFKIKAKETKIYRVTFVGDYGGVYQKHDRLMPEVTLVY